MTGCILRDNETCTKPFSDLLQLRQLTRLQITGQTELKEFPVGLLGISQMTALQHLVLPDACSYSTDDNGLSTLSTLTQLQRLEMAGNGLVGLQAQHLIALTRLTGLDLSDTPSTHALVDGLSACTSLRALALLEEEAEEEAEAPLHFPSSLRYLCIHGRHIAGNKNVTALTNLTSLDVTVWGDAPDELDRAPDELCFLSNIQVLRLTFYDVVESLAAISSLAGLTDLHVSVLNTCAPLPILAGLRSLSIGKLVNIRLMPIPYEPNFLVYISAFTSLEKLSITCAAQHESVVPVGGWTTLTRLTEFVLQHSHSSQTLQDEFLLLPSLQKVVVQRRCLVGVTLSATRYKTEALDDFDLCKLECDSEGWRDYSLPLLDLIGDL